MIKQLENTESDFNMLFAFMQKVEKDFVVPLSKKVNLKNYVNKLLFNGCVLAIIDNNEMLSCRAFYCNDLEHKIAYGSFMSTLSKAQGKGYAKLLIKEMIRICHEKGFHSIISASINPKAIALYKSMGYDVIREEVDNGYPRIVLEYILDK